MKTIVSLLSCYISKKKQFFSKFKFLQRNEPKLRNDFRVEEMNLRMTIGYGRFRIKMICDVYSVFHSFVKIRFESSDARKKNFESQSIRTKNIIRSKINFYKKRSSISDLCLVHFFPRHLSSSNQKMSLQPSRVIFAIEC